MARVDFVDETGDRWQEFEVYHGNILNYIEEIFNEKITDLNNLLKISKIDSPVR